MTYDLVFTESALKEFKKLGGSVKAELVKQLKKVCENPHQPSKKLRGDLQGYYKIKLRASGYRAMYSVIDDVLVVEVIKVGKRDDIYKH
ncbi:type II toxin-antitoxin system RelE family toxin [Vibrio owensii]|uniref:RelE-like toxin protein n=1 Tax=Vibrio owensii CAIM 1854 = LMG 25443 TaxID=1229493 RepID=A0A0C1YS01_9VIBR|nr:type II toxin-antitoxin system RelE/ParE family toxin [Vibrio owensii]KIF46849.1 RelE-like toxin protein [Vibrio owensii CAIM 1854 = LMG 25443]